MKVLFERSFLKDLQKVPESDSRLRIGEFIEIIKKSETLRDIPNVKKIHGGHKAFRIRVGDLRIGFFLDKDQVILSRCLHRKEINKLFPGKS